MTPQQIQLVRDSFALVQPIAADAARLFYGKLFARDPGLRHLFRGDMAEQGDKLMQMIGAAVALLGRPAALQPVLEHLGRRHGGYGVRDEHYDTVGAALLETLAEGLGEAFTAEARDAWSAMYGFVARTMQRAANDVMAEAA